MRWQTTLRRHFGERSDLELSELAREFRLPESVPEEVLRDCLQLFEQEYEVPFSRLRPDDGLELFSEPPRTKNPVSWLFNRAAIEDRLGELNHQLFRQRRAIGAPPLQRAPTTMREYVLAWAGVESVP